MKMPAEMGCCGAGTGRLSLGGMKVPPEGACCSCAKAIPPIAHETIAQAMNLISRVFMARLYTRRECLFRVHSRLNKMATMGS